MLNLLINVMMNRTDSREIENHATALENRAKAVKVLLQKINLKRGETEKFLELLRLGREYSIFQFSPGMNYQVFSWIIKFRDNPQTMRIIMDWYRLHCLEYFFSELKEDSVLEDKIKQKLFALFAYQFLNLSFDNGHISSFVIGQRKVGLEELINMEASMQIKVDSLRYKMVKEQARFENLLDKMDKIEQI